MKAPRCGAQRVLLIPDAPRSVLNSALVSLSLMYVIGAVKIDALGIPEIRIRNVGWFRCPVGRHKPAERESVVPGPELVASRFCIAFFAGELVVNCSWGNAHHSAIRLHRA